MKIVLFFAMTETSLSDIYIAPLSYPWFLCSLCEPSTDQKYLEEKKKTCIYTITIQTSFIMTVVTIITICTALTLKWGS